MGFNSRFKGLNNLLVLHTYMVDTIFVSNSREIYKNLYLRGDIQKETNMFVNIRRAS